MAGKGIQVTSPIGSPTSGNISDSYSKDQDRFLPIANVSRIMKKSLPSNAKISKEAKETVQECVSEFISFITGEASDKCQREKRKTINGDDLLWAMTTLGFDNYVGPLKIYLNKYREIEGEKNTMARHEDYETTFPSDYFNASYNNHEIITKINGSSSSASDFHSFNNMSFTKGIDYSENLASMAGYSDNNMSRIIQKNGDGTDDTSAAAAHGLQW